MSQAEDESPVGKSAHVIEAIPGGDKAGEVLVRIRGGSEAYIAFSDQPIAVGDQVIVLADRGARMLLVAPL